MKIWAWLFKFSKKKIQEAHMKKHSSDIKCTNCKEWYSISGIEYNHKFETKDYGYSTECGKCKAISYWNCEAAPLPLLCSENGDLII